MYEGIVKWFNYQRGYGFIESTALDGDIFLHHTAFVHHDEYIHEGGTVLFEIAPGEKGVKAINVTLKE